jgi:general stress protein YciG
MPNEVAVTDSETVVSVPVKIKKPRGFAAMSPEKRAAISALGGKRAHELGVAHRYTSEEAALAGKSGGTAPHVSRGRGKSE